MERKNKDQNPIYYGSAEEMDKPLSVLMEDLRNDITKIRGKMYDIKKSYGWEDRIEHLEGGLTCIIVAMHDAVEEFRRFEKREEEQLYDVVINTSDRFVGKYKNKRISIIGVEEMTEYYFDITEDNIVICDGSIKLNGMEKVIRHCQGMIELHLKLK